MEVFAIQGRRKVRWVTVHDAEFNEDISNAVVIEIRRKRYAEDSLYLPLNEVASLNVPSWGSIRRYP